MAKKDNTILYIGAGLAAVYLITRQQQQPTQIAPITPATGWQDVAMGAVNILGQILPGLIGGGQSGAGTPGIGNAPQNAVNNYKVPAEQFTGEAFAKWN